MAKKREYGLHPVVNNIIKLMNDRGLTQAAMAEYMDIHPSQMSKVKSGKVQLNIWQISNLATSLGISIIDIFSYPDVYTKSASNADDINASITIELKKEKKEKVLKIIFGEENFNALR